jgi:hypothetical protein
VKKVGPAVKLKEGSDLWNLMKERENLDPEKEAQKAAEAARKRAQAELDKRAAEHQAYLDSLRYIEKMEFKTADIRRTLEVYHSQYNELKEQASKQWSLVDKTRKELQEKCTHDLVIERQTRYNDEYDQWHDGPMQRKCIECYLVEENYDYSLSKKYDKLRNSKVILLRRTINGEVYEVEFDDLKW